MLVEKSLQLWTQQADKDVIVAVLGGFVSRRNCTHCVAVLLELTLRVP